MRNYRGLKIGDKIKYLGEEHIDADLKFPIGTILTVVSFGFHSDVVHVTTSNGKTTEVFSLGRLWEKVNTKPDFGLIRGDKIKVLEETFFGEPNWKFKCDEILTIHETCGNNVVFVLNEEGLELAFDLYARKWIQIHSDKPTRLTPSQHRVEFIASLAAAIQQAGGSVEEFIRHDITLDELANSLAQNGIRFVFDKSLVK